jgi:hypothetical protein
VCERHGRPRERIAQQLHIRGAIGAEMGAHSQRGRQARQDRLGEPTIGERRSDGWRRLTGQPEGGQGMAADRLDGVQAGHPEAHPHGRAAVGRVLDLQVLA